MKLPFESDEAKQLKIEIFQTIYFAALTESMEISKKRKILLDRYMLLMQDISKEFSIDINKLYDNTEIKRLDSMIDEKIIEFIKLNKIIKPIPEELTNFDKIGGAYSSYYNSPASKGILQFDMWNVTPLVTENVNYFAEVVHSQIFRVLYL